MGDIVLAREKLVKYGEKALEDYELLAIILGTGSKNENVFELAKNILNQVSNTSELVNMSYHELINIKGIKRAKATKIIASIELAKRIFKNEKEEIYFKNPKEIYDFYKYDFINKKEELLVVLFFNSKMRLVTKKVLAIGGENIIHMEHKKIFMEAFKLGAVEIQLPLNGSLKVFPF